MRELVDEDPAYCRWILQQGKAGDIPKAAIIDSSAAGREILLSVQATC